MTSRIAPDDLRRAKRMIIALFARDEQVLDLVTAGVAAADRWMQHGLACAVVARTVLVQIDEDEEGATVMWLHSAVEKSLSGADAWWLVVDDE
jgi:hypothetical protein